MENKDKFEFNSNKFIPYGYVYRITNSVNGKTYIGQRKLSLDKSWRQYMGSGKLLKQSIKKYGLENFVKSFVYYGYSSEELDSKEQNSIKEAWETGKGEYNLVIRAPVADNNLILTDVQIEVWKKKLKESSKVQGAALGKFNHERAVLKYLEFLSRISDKNVVELYKEFGSAKKVSKVISESGNYIMRFLKESGVEINVRTVKGVRHSEETRNKISKTVSLKETHKSFLNYNPEEEKISDNCNVCGNRFQRTKKSPIRHCSRPCKIIFNENKRRINEIRKMSAPQYIQKPLFEKIKVASCLNCKNSFSYAYIVKEEFCSVLCEKALEEKIAYLNLRNVSLRSISTILKINKKIVSQKYEKLNLTKNSPHVVYSPHGKLEEFLENEIFQLKNHFSE